jgi:CRISPR-associated protein Csm3
MSQIQNTITGKLIISGKIELLTGLHIGCGGQSGIGLIDSPVIRHPLTSEPYIPGSSLKGRLRSALDTILGENHSMVNKIYGTTPNKDEGRCTSQIYVRDSHLSSGQKLKDIAEVKYENKISRLTGTTVQGGLRQIERIIAGTCFDFEIVYNIDDNCNEDLKHLRSCFEFVEDEYLGASGSRGYGKVKFHFSKLIYKPLEYYSGERQISTQETDAKNWTEKAIELIK